MKIRVLAFLLVVLGAASSVSAQQNSLVYGPLAKSPTFQGRVVYIITTQAPVVLTEAQTGSYTAACHTLRAALAARVAASPMDFASIFAAHLVTNINVTSGGALTGTVGAGTLDTPATDAALLAAVASQWSSVAGCITNP
jgi:hypothetical protein